jgi:uncharacterized protein
MRAETIAPGGSWSGILKRSEVLRIVDVEGQQGVDFLCYSATNPEERYHAANTLKRAATLWLTKGHVLYSDVARPMMTIVGDTCGFHDTIAGCCSAPSNEMLYGVKGVSGCRENFLKELRRHGLGRKDVVANLNFFCNVPAGMDNSLPPLIFAAAPSQPGDWIALRAETDVLAVISNCPQVNNPCSGGKPTAIRIEMTAP